jgi:ubiquitin C-terminal hydrolase
MVNYPITDLDLSSLLFEKTKQHYNLCGVINHFGNINDGHYTATCLNENDGLWYSYNDSNVNLLTSPE